MSDDDSDQATRTSANLDAPFAGQTLGSYQLGPLLAEGGMGQVYAAYDPRLRRDVAIKVVPAALAEDPERLRRLEREARAAAALNHPNILAVHDIGTQDGVPFIVMERVNGQTLAAQLGHKRLTLNVALDIAVQISDALAAVHAGGIVHRDLKPLNVMVTPEGRVKILDFGLAKATLSETEGTRTASFVTEAGQLFGTPAYMAPERFGAGSADGRADIFSLGVMLFEMVTGRRPFAGHDFLSVVEHMLTGPVPLVEDFEPSVPAALSTAISRCLARDPDERYGSAAELRDELARIRSVLGDSETDVTPPVMVRLRRAWRRATARPHRQVVGWLAASALVVAATGLWLWPAPAPTAERPTIVVLPFATSDDEPSTAYLGVGLADAVTTSLSKLSSLSVVSRETAREPARGTSDPAKLARDLGADVLVKGTLQRSGERVLVDATVLGADGSVIWRGTVAAALSNPSDIEKRLADRIVRALGVKVSADERERLAVPQASSPAALEAYWRGMSFLERTDVAGLDSAIGSFETAIMLDPNYAVAHAGLGTAFVRKYSATKDQAWMSQAADSVRRALEIDPSQAEVRLSLANVYRSTGRNGSAVEELRRVLADEPTNDEALRRLGSIFESEGRQSEALQQFRAAIDRRPAYWLNHDVLGLFYYRSGEFDDAVRAFTRVTELRPDSAQAFQRLGTAYVALGDKTQARENLKRAIAITPDAASYSNLGTLYYAEGQYGEAAAAYREAIRLRPNRALLHRNLGDAYRRLGRPVDAKSEYHEAANLAREALRVNPNDARLMAQLALYEAKLGRKQEADILIRRAVAANPADAEVLSRRAAVLALSGDGDEAVKAVENAVANGFAIDLVRDDDDLESLRSMPAFQSIISPKRPGSPKGARP